MQSTRDVTKQGHKERVHRDTSTGIRNQDERLGLRLEKNAYDLDSDLKMLNVFRHLFYSIVFRAGTDQRHSLKF